MGPSKGFFMTSLLSKCLSPLSTLSDKSPVTLVCLAGRMALSHLHVHLDFIADVLFRRGVTL